MKRSIVLVLLALIALTAWCRVPPQERRGQIDHASLQGIRVYAYRDWQSVGFSPVSRVKTSWEVLPHAYGNQ